MFDRKKWMKFWFRLRNRETICGIRIVAIFENLVFYSALIGLKYLLGDSDRWMQLRPHPFWIAILVSSVKYGTREGLFSAFLGTVFLYAGNLPPPMFSESSLQYELRLIDRPLLWFLTAFLLGEMSTNLSRERDKLKESLAQSLNERDTIARQFEKSKRNRRSLERELASHQMGFVSIYQAFRSLESLQPGQIIMNIDQAVLKAIKPEKFSVYAYGKNGFEAVRSHNWNPNDEYNRRIEKGNDLYESLVNQRKMLCIVNDKDKKILRNQGILAAPLINSDTEEVFGLLKIEEIPFDDLSYSTLEMFRILCDLVGITYANAVRFKHMQEGAMYTGEGALSHTMYKHLHQWSFGQIHLEAKILIHKTVDIELCRRVGNYLQNLFKEAPLQGGFFSGDQYLREWIFLSTGSSLKTFENELNRIVQKVSDQTGIDEQAIEVKITQIESNKTVRGEASIG